MQKERKIWTNAVKKIFKRYGWSYIKISDRYRHGTLDFYVYKKSLGAWIEFKTPEGQLSELQKIEISNLLTERIPVFVVSSIEEAEKIITCGESRPSSDAPSRTAR